MRRIKLSLSDMKIMGIRFSEYKIEFQNNDPVSFWVSSGSNKLSDFEETARNINPDVIIKHWASSFDS